MCMVGAEVKKYQEFYRLWKSGGLVETVVVRKGISRKEYVWPESNLREILETMLVFQKSILQYLKKGQIRQNGGVITFLLQNERFWNLQVMFDEIQCDIAHFPEFLLALDGFTDTFAGDKLISETDLFQGLIFKNYKVRTQMMISLLALRRSNKITPEETPYMLQSLKPIFYATLKLVFSIYDHCTAAQLFKTVYFVANPSRGKISSFTNTALEFLTHIANLNQDLHEIFDQQITLKLFIDVHYRTHEIRSDDTKLFTENEDEWIELYNDVVGDHTSKCLKSRTMDLIETLCHRTELGMSIIFNLCLRMLNKSLSLSIDDNQLFKSLDTMIPPQFALKILDPTQALSVINVAFLT
jgi:hypothetical protein